MQLTHSKRPVFGTLALATAILAFGPPGLPEAHAQPYYNVEVPWITLEAIYDLQSGRYLALGMKNEEKRAYDFGFTASKADFQPAALRQSGIR